MLKKHAGHPNFSRIPLSPIFSIANIPILLPVTIFPSAFGASSTFCVRRRDRNLLPHARRMVRYYQEDEDEDEEYGHNAEIAMIESYTELAQDEVLLVRAMVDGQEEEVMVFKGFSSALSYRTSPDPSRSVLPARAVIKSIDRIKGPFDPSNIEYLEKDLAWEVFKKRLQN
ncbi:hypothetical protein CKAN_00467400 [Cinnamomum micranthum f. kanehirae]|uniref:DUF7734 domain-containing protein n=1 Tax=Cinnamomum micranthum f. kanehirae TaxID=337451 RepID=A0A3S3NBA3_9MAGN|nr:hypothetical protein CKAN_00467400 [Cinnamomum micranthum f. kanehirae]